MSRPRCIYREEHNDTHLEIWDDGERRSLWFDDVILQSEIHLHDPAVLPNPVNRAMLAHLMFEPQFDSVLLAGCGGGSIARWLHARAPQITGDAVELSPTIARLAREYFDFPPTDSNWRLLIDDVREHLVHGARAYDFILVDLEENQVTPDWVTDTGFLHGCRRRLTAHGVLTINLLAANDRALSESLMRIRRVFTGDTLLVSDPEHDNLLAIAFRQAAPPLPPPAALEAAGRHWGIDFVSLSQRLERLAAAPADPAGQA